MSLIPYETIFPDVISIWHRLHKEKHMLAIRGVMRMLFLGNQFSSAILKNLHVHYLFEKTHKCWALAEVTFWAEQSLLMLRVTYFAWCPEQKATQQPRWAALAKESGIWAWGWETVVPRDPAQTFSTNDWFISTSGRLQFGICFLLSLIFMLKASSWYKG